MGRRGRRIAEGLLHRRAMRIWARAASEAPKMDMADLRLVRGRARALRGQIERVLHHAEGRLALPMVGADTIDRPLHTDWAWRPELWRGPVDPPGIVGAPNKARLGSELRLFHDCPLAEMTLRQQRNTRREDLAPYGLRLDVFRFRGSFLSLAIALPEAAAAGMKRRHLVGLAMAVEMERPIEIFARLNLRHGPNSEQLVREVQLEGGRARLDFDLAYSNLNEKRMEQAWLDLIFEGPAMNLIVLRDLTLTRRPRAEL